MTDDFTTPERFRRQLLDALVAHAGTTPASDPAPTASGQAGGRPAGVRIIVRRLAPAVTIAAILAAAALLLRSGGALRPEPATAAGVLNASASALEHRGGSRALGENNYFYTKLAVWWRYAGLSRHPYVVRSVQEEWLARDGRGRSRYQVVGLSGTGVNRSLPLTRSQDAQERRSRARPFILSSVPSPGILLSYAQLRRLPTDPSGLAAAIDGLVARYHVNRAFPQRDIRTAIRFEILRGLADAPTSASLRAAIYRVLAATPGIRLLGRTRDSIGRYGMAVAVNVEDARLELIIDPTTGELLQTSRTLLRRSTAYLDGKQPPGLINQATYLADGIVASVHGRAR
jgi:hypothetical protein